MNSASRSKQNSAFTVIQKSRDAFNNEIEVLKRISSTGVNQFYVAKRLSIQKFGLQPAPLSALQKLAGGMGTEGLQRVTLRLADDGALLHLISEYDFKTLQQLRQFCQERGGLVEATLVALLITLLEVGARLQDALLVHPELSSKAVKVALKENPPGSGQIRFTFRLSNPLMNDDSLAQLSNFLNDICKGDKDFFDSSWCFDARIRTRFLQKSNLPSLEAWRRVDHAVRQQAKRGVYRLFWLLLATALNKDPEQLAAELSSEKNDNRLRHLITSLKLSKPFEEALLAILLVQDVQKLPTFSELWQRFRPNTEAACEEDSIEIFTDPSFLCGRTTGISLDLWDFFELPRNNTSPQPVPASPPGSSKQNFARRFGSEAHASSKCPSTETCVAMQTTHKSENSKYMPIPAYPVTSPCILPFSSAKTLKQGEQTFSSTQILSSFKQMLDQIHPAQLPAFTQNGGTNLPTPTKDEEGSSIHYRDPGTVASHLPPIPSRFSQKAIQEQLSFTPFQPLTVQAEAFSQQPNLQGRHEQPNRGIQNVFSTSHNKFLQHPESCSPISACAIGSFWPGSGSSQRSSPQDTLKASRENSLTHFACSPLGVNEVALKVFPMETGQKHNARSVDKMEENQLAFFVKKLQPHQSALRDSLTESEKEIKGDKHLASSSDRTPPSTNPPLLHEATIPQKMPESANLLSEVVARTHNDLLNPQVDLPDNIPHSTEIPSFVPDSFESLMPNSLRKKLGIESRKVLNSDSQSLKLLDFPSDQKIDMHSLKFPQNWDHARKDAEERKNEERATISPLNVSFATSHNTHNYALINSYAPSSRNNNIYKKYPQIESLPGRNESPALSDRDAPPQPRRPHQALAKAHHSMASDHPALYAEEPLLSPKKYSHSPKESKGLFDGNLSERAMMKRSFVRQGNLRSSQKPKDNLELRTSHTSESSPINKKKIPASFPHPPALTLMSASLLDKIDAFEAKVKQYDAPSNFSFFRNRGTSMAHKERERTRSVEKKANDNSPFRKVRLSPQITALRRSYNTSQSPVKKSDVKVITHGDIYQTRKEAEAPAKHLANIDRKLDKLKIEIAMNKDRLSPAPSPDRKFGSRPSLLAGEENKAYPGQALPLHPVQPCNYIRTEVPPFIGFAINTPDTFLSSARTPLRQPPIDAMPRETAAEGYNYRFCHMTKIDRTAKSPAGHQRHFSLEPQNRAFMLGFPGEREPTIGSANGAVYHHTTRSYKELLSPSFLTKECEDHGHWASRNPSHYKN